MTLRHAFRLELPLVSSGDMRSWSLGSHYVACADGRRIFVVDTFTAAIVDEGEAPEAAFGGVSGGSEQLAGAENFHVASLDDGTFVLPCYSDALDFHWIPARWTPGVGFEWGVAYVGPDVPDGYRYSGLNSAGQPGKGSFSVAIGGTASWLETWDQGVPTLVHLGGGTFWSAGPRSEWDELRLRRNEGTGHTVMATFEVYDDGGPRIRRLTGPATFPRRDDDNQGEWLPNVSGVAVPMGGSIVWPLGLVDDGRYLVVVPPQPDYAGRAGHVLYMDSGASSIAGVTSVPTPPPRSYDPYWEYLEGAVGAPYGFVLDDDALRLPYGRPDWGHRELVVRSGSVTAEQMAPPPAGHTVMAVSDWAGSAPVRMRSGVNGVTYRPVESAGRSVGLLMPDGAVAAMAPPPSQGVSLEEIGVLAPLPSGDVVLARVEDDRAAFHFFLPPLPPRELRAGAHRKRGYFS